MVDGPSSVVTAPKVTESQSIKKPKEDSASTLNSAISYIRYGALAITGLGGLGLIATHYKLPSALLAAFGAVLSIFAEKASSYMPAWVMVNVFGVEGNSTQPANNGTKEELPNAKKADAAGKEQPNSSNTLPNILDKNDLNNDEKVIQWLDSLEKFATGKKRTDLRQNASNELVEQLVSLLDNKNADIKIRAADILGNYGNKDAVVPLSKLLSEDKIQNSAITSLQNMASDGIEIKDIVPQLIDACKDVNPVFRSLVAQTLNLTKDLRSVDVLTNLLKDKSPGSCGVPVFVYAAEALCELAGVDPASCIKAKGELDKLHKEYENSRGDKTPEGEIEQVLRWTLQRISQVT